MNHKDAFQFCKSQAEKDPRYRKMLMECRQLEQVFLQFEETLLPEQRDIIWDYLMICEDMNQLLLKIMFQQLTGL